MTQVASKRGSAGRIVLAVVSGITAIVALALLAAGGAVLWADQTQRDDAGYYISTQHRFASGSYAITHEGVDVHGIPAAIDVGKLAKIRIRATGAEGKPIFVGIARESDAAAYLGGVAHSEVADLRLDPFRVTYDPVAGSHAPAAPASQSIWVASASGTGTTTLEWPVHEGTWTTVVMNADGTRGVAADVDVGADFGYLAWIWAGLFVAGGVLLALAALFAVLAARDGRGGGLGAPAEGGAARGATTPAASGPYPAVLTARLDEPLSRWLWIVKWLLAIPHWIVLAFLWIAFALLTVVAWIAILVTGRYPRSVFDFNVGVMRWTWRVAYYSTSAFGTDRYPPFSLGPEPEYPARLDVEYPAELSRWQALVKWILAIPHLLIVGVLVGGGSSLWFGSGHHDGFALGGSGLIGLLAIIAGVALLFTARYPRGLFDVVVGLNRWVLRVVAYAALMTDEYPPFRLDQGGDEPPAAPAAGGVVPAGGS